MSRILSSIGLVSLGLVLGGVLGAFWITSRWNDKEAKWKAARTAELADSSLAHQQSLADLTARLAASDSLRAIYREEARIARQRSLVYRDSAQIYRAALAQTTTLAECQAMGDRLGAACAESIHRAEVALERSDSNAVQLELKAENLGSMLRESEARAARLALLVQTAPVSVPQQRWLGFIPRPSKTAVAVVFFLFGILVNP